MSANEEIEAVRDALPQNSADAMEMVAEDPSVLHGLRARLTEALAELRAAEERSKIEDDATGHVIDDLRAEIARLKVRMSDLVVRDSRNDDEGPNAVPDILAGALTPEQREAIHVALNAIDTVNRQLSGEEGFFAPHAKVLQAMLDDGSEASRVEQQRLRAALLEEGKP